MARVLVMKPAGELSPDQGVVSHHADAPEDSVKHFYNIGDLYVYDSSLRILRHDTVEALDINSVSDERIEYYNANFDYCFLRGSNYINPNAQWGKASEVLERLKIPVMAFGIGVQIKTDNDLALNPETTRLLQQIAAKSTTIAVRGELSVKVLNSIGIKNVRVIGCPTVFRHRHDKLSIVKPRFEELRRVGFTLRRNTPNSTVFQRYLLHYLHQRFDLSIICAGELEEKTIYYASKGRIADPDARIAQCAAALVEKGWFYDAADPLIDVYRKNLFFAESVAEYDREVESLDAVLGYRLHGNLLSLANETPALYLTYDTRTREFVDTFKIPHFDVLKGEKFSFQAFYEAADFAPFEKAYRRQFGELRRFLDENNMPHQL
jgi:Polysaccharide pyruvyl transferase